MLSETQWQCRVGNKDFCLLSSSTMLLCIAHRKNRNVMMIYDQIERMLFQSNVGCKDATVT